MKEKTADEMFEELGYKKDEKPFKWRGRKVPYIHYRDEISFKTVSFDLEIKSINMSCVNKDHIKVLQAINKKVKELGWCE